MSKQNRGIDISNIVKFFDLIIFEEGFTFIKFLLCSLNILYTVGLAIIIKIILLL